jgi:hypothetical protein
MITCRHDDKAHAKGCTDNREKEGRETREIEKRAEKKKRNRMTK